MIAGAMEGGFISDFSIGEANTSSLNISYLLFADDTLLFCEVNHDHICALRALILCFEVIFRLKVNLGKSNVVQVGQVHNMDSMPSILGYKISHLPKKYLGLMFGAHYKPMSIWDDVLEKKIERKLTSWNRMYLSKGSGVTLSTLSTYQLIFSLYLFYFHQRWLMVWRIHWDFLWEGINDGFKFHLIIWATMCSPICKGGLDILNLQLYNSWTNGYEDIPKNMELFEE